MRDLLSAPVLRLKLDFPSLQMRHLFTLADPICFVIMLGSLQARAVQSCQFIWDQLMVLQTVLSCWFTSKGLDEHSVPY